MTHRTLQRTLKFTATSLLSAALISTAFAQNNPQPPLNKYGAVDVNANIPFNIQVPAVPKNFKAPVIKPYVQEWQNLIPSQPTFSGIKSYMLIAVKSGKILAAFNPNERVAPASLTKLMLLYITMQELHNGVLHLTDKVRVPKVAWATGGSRMFLRPGSQVSVRKLISGIIVDSGNDAAVTLAHYIAGTQAGFVDMMNHTAKKLGMTNTHFTDVMGLPAPSHYSSARDMAVLAENILKQFPQYTPWFGQKYFAYDGISQSNFNKLLFIYPDADGMKTGSTKAAGFSLIGTAHQPNHTMRLLSVMMGAPTNMKAAEYSKSLLTYGFRFFKTELLYPKYQSIQNINIYKGQNDTTPIGPMKNIYVTIPQGNNIKLGAQLELKKNLTAPVQKDQKVGNLVITANGKSVETVSIIALKSNPLGGWWTRTVDTVKGWF